MEQPLKSYALMLWGEYVRMKRTANSWLQSELGSRLEYSPGAAKQSVSQIEHGRIWIPKNKFNIFIRELSLDEDLFRRLDFLFAANDYGKMVSLLTDLLKSEFHFTPHVPKGLVVNKLPEGPTSPPIATGDLTERLKKLKEAFDLELIEASEYEEARKRILAQFVEGA